MQYLKRAMEQKQGLNQEHSLAAINILNAMPVKDALCILEFIMDYVIMETRVGLGLVDVPDDMEEPDISSLKMFNKIADCYEEAAAGCYFCSEVVDPNEDEFGPDTRLCMMCKLKLANFTAALGIPAQKVFNGLTARAQKTRIKINS
jgi:hypothetical protein